MAESRGQATSLQAHYSKLSAAQKAAMCADAKGWQPEDGDELTGIVVAIKSGYSDVKDANYPIVFLLTDADTCVAVHCFQTVIENEVRQARPMPGELMYVKRIGQTGESKKAGHSPTIRYAVYVEREGDANNPWEHMQ